MPIADSYRVTERVLEGEDMWIVERVLRGAGESYLGLSKEAVVSSIVRNKQRVKPQFYKRN